jgi:hypothetical protein
MFRPTLFIFRQIISYKVQYTVHYLVLIMEISILHFKNTCCFVIITVVVVVTNHNISIMKSVKIIHLKKVLNRRVASRICIMYCALCIVYCVLCIRSTGYCFAYLQRLQ